MYILNLTRHKASPAQIDVGVADMTDERRDKLINLVTFDKLPTSNEVATRALRIALLAHHTRTSYAMVGGAPYLMAALVSALGRYGIKALFAYSERVSDEDTVTGVKTSVFKHIGFVEA